jgi:hypothetical protein
MFVRFIIVMCLRTYIMSNYQNYIIPLLYVIVGAGMAQSVQQLYYGLYNPGIEVRVLIEAKDLYLFYSV